MFYANPSIKFADVAYRGAWVALGVEFNFPVSHNWMTVSPVDFRSSFAVTFFGIQKSSSKPSVY